MIYIVNEFSRNKVNTHEDYLRTDLWQISSILATNTRNTECTIRQSALHLVRSTCAALLSPTSHEHHRRRARPADDNKTNSFRPVLISLAPNFDHYSLGRVHNSDTPTFLRRSNIWVSSFPSTLNNLTKRTKLVLEHFERSWNENNDTVLLSCKLVKLPGGGRIKCCRRRLLR